MVLPFLFIRGGRLIATKLREAHLKALGTGTPMRLIDEDGKPGHKQFYFIEADAEHQVWLCWKSGFIPRKHRVQVLTTPRVEESKDEEVRAHLVIKTPDGDMTFEAPKDKEQFELWTRKLTELVEDQAALQAVAHAGGDARDAAAKVDEAAAKGDGGAAANGDGAAAESAEKAGAGGAATAAETKVAVVA